MTVGTIASVRKSLDESKYKGLYCVRILKKTQAEVFYAWISKDALRAIMLCSNILDINELTGKSVTFDEDCNLVIIPCKDDFYLGVQCKELPK